MSARPTRDVDAKGLSREFARAMYKLDALREIDPPAATAIMQALERQLIALRAPSSLSERAEER